MYLNLKPSPHREGFLRGLLTLAAMPFVALKSRRREKPLRRRSEPVLIGSTTGDRYLTAVPTTQEEAASIVKRMAARHVARKKAEREEEARLIRQGYDPETKSFPLGGDGMGYVPTVQMSLEQVEEVQRRLSAHPEGAWQEFLRQAGEAPSAKD